MSSDYSRIQGVIKEHASLRELVSLAREYRRLTRELEDVRSMLSEESDHELAAMAREELTQLEESLEGSRPICEWRCCPGTPTTTRTWS